VLEQVSQPSDLRLLLVADQDRGVAPCPQLVGPTLEAIDLFGDVALRVAEECGELLGVLDTHVEVGVGGLEVDAVDLDVGVLLRPREHTDDALVEPRLGPQQKASADGPRRDLDHAHSGRVAGRG
jgi:hypothetical protein